MLCKMAQYTSENKSKLLIEYFKIFYKDIYKRNNNFIKYFPTVLFYRHGGFEKYKIIYLA